MEERYIYQVFISKASVGFFLLVPIHITPPGGGVFRKPQGLQQGKAGDRKLPPGNSGCCQPQPWRSELMNQHCLLDFIPALPSFSIIQMCYRGEKSAAVLNSGSKIGHMHASQSWSDVNNPVICFTSFTSFTSFYFLFKCSFSFCISRAPSRKQMAEYVMIKKSLIKGQFTNMSRWGKVTWNDDLSPRRKVTEGSRSITRLETQGKEKLLELREGSGL